MSKASGNISWVPVVSQVLQSLIPPSPCFLIHTQTYWTLNMTGTLVNNTPVYTGADFAVCRP